VLEELVIRDVGVLDRVDLQLGGGLTVVTGETGAGKTMIVSALDLLTGARAEGDQVRRGADVAVVEARLRPPPPGAGEWLSPGDEDLVVTREIGAGRSRVRIAGRLAPVSALAQTVGTALEHHGQFDTTKLATPAVQRELLDRWGGPVVTAALDAYRGAYQTWRTAGEQLAALEGGDRDRAREADRLAFEVAEIDAVDPRAGEEVELEADLRRLEHAEELITSAATAAEALAADGGARDSLGVAASALRGVRGMDDALEELSTRVEGLAAEAQDLAFSLSGYASGLELDPARLEDLRARRAGLARLVRKYGTDAAAVKAYAQDARTRLASLNTSDEQRAALAAEVTALAERLTQLGAALSDRRRDAGLRLSRAIEEHLSELAMAAARMTVAVEPTPPGPEGADRVTFLLAANPGEASLPLAKAASGGERSRVALAVRLALAAADQTPVLVFDEVDAGIGGAVALAVGRQLARLARGRQVLCVTHLAQLAAFADAHLVVSKVTVDGRTVASVRTLTEADRVEELARMLSGTPDSDAASHHAADLRARALELA
jgi:DNA repair protein RecN (Recombination protein N)